MVTARLCLVSIQQSCLSLQCRNFLHAPRFFLSGGLEHDITTILVRGFAQTLDWKEERTATLLSGFFIDEEILARPLFSQCSPFTIQLQKSRGVFEVIVSSLFSTAGAGEQRRTSSCRGGNR
jgi:hypothetical protein